MLHYGDGWRLAVPLNSTRTPVGLIPVPPLLTTKSSVKGSVLGIGNSSAWPKCLEGSRSKQNQELTPFWCCPGPPARPASHSSTQRTWIPRTGR